MFKAWFDPDKKTSLQKKAAQAIQNYQEATGKKPTLMLVTPDAQPELEGKFGSLDVRGMSIMRPNTFYVGQHEDL